MRHQPRSTQSDAAYELKVDGWTVGHYGGAEGYSASEVEVQGKLRYPIRTRVRGHPRRVSRARLTLSSGAGQEAAVVGRIHHDGEILLGWASFSPEGLLLLVLALAANRAVTVRLLGENLSYRKAWIRHVSLFTDGHPEVEEDSST